MVVRMRRAFVVTGVSVIGVALILSVSFFMEGASDDVAASSHYVVEEVMADTDPDNPDNNHKARYKSLSGYFELFFNNPDAAHINWPKRPGAHPNDPCDTRGPNGQFYKTLPWLGQTPDHIFPSDQFRDRVYPTPSTHPQPENGDYIHLAGDCFNRYLDGGTYTKSESGVRGAWGELGLFGGWTSRWYDDSSWLGVHESESKHFDSDTSPAIWGLNNQDDRDHSVHMFCNNDYPDFEPHEAAEDAYDDACSEGYNYSHPESGHMLVSSGTTFFRNTFRIDSETYQDIQANPDLYDVYFEGLADDWMNVFINGNHVVGTKETAQQTAEHSIVDDIEEGENVIAVQVADKAAWILAGQDPPNAAGLWYQVQLRRYAEKQNTIRGKKVDEEHNADSSEPWYSNTVTVEGGNVRQLDNGNPFSFTDLPSQEYQVSVEGESGYATSWIYCRGDGSVNRVEQDGTCEESGTTATSGDGTSFSVQLQTDEIIDVRFIFDDNPNEPDHKIYGANHIRIPQEAYRDNKNFKLGVWTYLWPNAGIRNSSLLGSIVNPNNTRRLWLAGIWGDDSNDLVAGEGHRKTDPNKMTKFNTEAEKNCPNNDDCLQRVPMAYVPHRDDNNDNGSPYPGRQDGSSTPRGNNWRKIREEAYGSQSHRLVRSCRSYNDGRYNTYCGGIASDLTDSIDGEDGNHIKNVEVSNIRVRGHRPDALLEDDAFEFQGDVNNDKLQPHAQSINLPGQGPITSPAWDNIRKPSTGLLNGSITDNRFLFSNPGFGSPRNFDDDPESVGRSEYTNRSKEYAEVEATTLLQLDADANEGSSSSGDTLIIGEAGTFTTPGHDKWTTINFQNYYEDPVVVGTSNSHNGGQKALVFEAEDVTSTSARMRICEGEGSAETGCDTHKREKIGYVVIDASKTDSVPGIEAGTFRINSEMDTKSTTVNFENETFDSTPIVLTAPHTSNGVSPVETRAWNISTTNFTGAICQMKLGDQYNCDENHVEEEVSWVAVEPGSGPFHEKSEANSTGKIAANSEPVTVNFAPNFSGSPAVIVEQQTEDGPQESEVDEAYDVTSSGAKVRYCEMESDPDDCHSHVTEDIGWLAIESGELTADSSEEDEDNDQPLYDANREPLTYTATLDKLRRVDLVWDEYVDWNQVDDKGHWYTRKTRRATGVDRGEPDDNDVAHLEDPDRGTAEEDEHYHCDWHYADHDDDGDKEWHCHKQWEDEHCDWERYRDGVGYRYNNKSYYDDRTRSRYGWYNTQTTTRSMPYGRDGEAAQSAFWHDYSDQPPWSHANVKNFWQDRSITSMDNANSSNKPSHSSRWIYNTTDPAYSNRHLYTDWERPRFKTSWYYEYSSICMYDNGSFDDYEEDVDTHYHNAEKVYEDTEDREIDGHVYGKYGNDATFDGDSDGQVDYRWSWSSNKQRVRYENSYDKHYRKLGPRFRVTSNDQYRLRGVEGNREMRAGRDIAYIYNPTVSASEGDIFAADNIHSYFQTSQAGSAFLFSDSQIVNFDSSGSQYEGYQIHDSPNRVDAYYPSGGHEASNDPVRYIFRNYDELTSRAGSLNTSSDKCSDHRRGAPSTSGNFNLERGDSDTIRDNIYLSDGDMRIGRTEFRNTAGTIIVEGDLCIEGDITYGGSGNNRENVPSVGFIVHGHIVIEDNVTRLNGSYFSGGEIYTGSKLLDVTRINSNDRRIGWEPNNDRDVDGDRPLRLNGLMVGNSYVLARQPSGSANRSGARAESFNYDGRVVINPPPGFSRVFTADAVWNDTVPRN